MKYMELTIQTQQPVKLGFGGGQTDVEKALNYIPGSTIRGMFIQKYIKKNGLSELREDDYWLLKDVYFGDGMIAGYWEGKAYQSIPVPMIYFAKKDDLRKNGLNGLSVKTIMGDKSELSEEEKNVGTGQFCFIKRTSKKCNICPVNMVDNLHINIGDDGEDSQLFRYEAIDRDQTFICMIGYSEEHEDEIKDVIKENDIIYIGGSKSSGYGRCLILDCIKIEEDSVLKREKRVEPSTDKLEKQYFTIYALSNLLLKNEDGSVASYIPESLLETALGLENIKFEKAFTHITITNGFNFKWNGRLVQQSAVAAGSVFVYSFEGNWDKERAKEIEKRGIGERKQEGFGKIIFNMDMQCSEMKVYENKDEEKYVEEKYVNEDKILLDNEDKETIQRLVNNIYQKRVRDAFRNVGYSLKSLESNVHNISLSLSNSQISELYYFLMNLNDNTEDKNKLELKNFVQNIEKRNNSITKKVYSNSYINGTNLFNYLKDMAEDKTKFTSSISGLNNNRVELCGIYSKEITNFEKKKLYLKNILYFYMRERGE
ncbi:hypothetical protein EHE19_008690 [Ruminiclostridium herbifermentans]|uniref:CRISPR type III-associated protein domain-containing protein n=1 Tax=Ruminiclostridium herbifermentans TaxID=2488810 RepID=A0A4U7JL13_9FIRM|nr:RAMP superfamily CRISPR-associated protein [Ruminiclostridium herbifermentans]QNU68457.1 hypothetical protein EHE19_008690 [Ruminiclostridium herbifermentans]